MASSEPKKVKLKLMIDKTTNKVIFAEAGSDFVDVLFNLLSLTFSTAIRLLGNRMFGCLGNLYESLENLNEAYKILHPNRNKSVLPLLNSKTPEFFSFQTSPQKKFYTCSNNHSYVTNEIDTLCPACPFRSVMNRELNPKKTVLDSNFKTKELVSYMVTDDLVVTPGSMTTSIGLLNGIVKDLSDLEERVVEIDAVGILELLNVSLQLKAVLTTIFLKKKEGKDEALTNKIDFMLV